MNNKPNILLICTDALRADSIGTNGNPIVNTPNIDKLAEEGVNFSRAYCTQPICMPSRASIMSGQWPKVHGVWINGISFADNNPTLPRVLSKAYESLLHGANAPGHIGGFASSVRRREGLHTSRSGGRSPVS